jgi:competence protein ComEC
MKVLDFPLSKITLVFILGLLFSHYIEINLVLVLSILTIAFFGLLFLFFRSKQFINSKLYFGFATYLLSFLVGVTTETLHNQKLNSNHYFHQLSEKETIYQTKLIIKEQLKNTLNNDRYVAKVVQLNNKISYGNIILNINKDSLSRKIPVGSICLVTGDIYKNRNPNNPNQFDYGKYLQNQQIFAQQYSDYETVKINSIPEKSLNYYAAKIRDRIINNLEKKHFNKEELSVLNALILGQRQEISTEIIRNYQYAGAIHILSVSGLHVGIILMILTFLLKPIPNSKKGIFVKLIITILGLWSFGVLAGLSPSIVRSVTMFSFVSIGYYLRRSVNIYHTLLVSILLILLFKPSFLFDIGFQLSYLALFFIVWLQPILKRIWSPKNKFINYFWDILTVSFAAQIGTFPLSLYYFHQFPGLFFISNLIILPMLGLIMALGIVVLVLAFFNYIPFYPMKLLELSITLLNKIIAWVASFESFIFKEVPLNTSMFICLYLLLIFLILWIINPTYKKLITCLGLIILFQSINLYTKFKSQNINEFIVFNRKGYTLITERNNEKVTVFSNDSILNTIDDNLVLKSYLVANFCKKDKLKLLQNQYFFGNKKITLIDSSGVYLENKNPDILLLSNSPRINLERYLKSCKPKLIVVDASNFSSYRKVWKATCLKEKILFHDTTEKGFYRLE